ncbi:MAG: hypothetical protein ACLFUF_04815 [Opitutales bacterium]
MIRQIQVFALLAVAAILLSACGSNSSGTSFTRPESTNVLGIYKHESEIFSPTGPATFQIKTDELVARRNFSGDKTQLLWGLVSLEDY